MSDKQELVTLLETLSTGDRTERQEIDTAIDSLTHGDAQNVVDTLWDTILGCDTPSSRLIERRGCLGKITDLGIQVSEQAELEVFQINAIEETA